MVHSAFYHLNQQWIIMSKKAIGLLQLLSALKAMKHQIKQFGSYKD